MPKDYKLNGVHQRVKRQLSPISWFICGVFKKKKKEMLIKHDENNL